VALNKKTTLTIILSVMLLTSLTTGFKAVKLASADTSSSSPATWNELFGGLSNYIVSSLVNTSDGGYAIAGSVNSTAAFLIKTDSNGSVQWSKTYEGLGSVHIYSMVQTSDGGYILAGGTASNATTDSSDWYFWLVKTDSSGNQEWSKTYEQPTTSGVYSVIQTSDGGYALVGSATYGNEDDPVALFVKIDASGTLKWNQTYSESDWAYAKSVVQASDGGYVLAGTTNPHTRLAEDYWLVKTDNNGKIEWTKTYNDSGGAGASAIVQTNNGGYTLAGYIGGFGPMWIWVVNVDSNGTMLWNTTWPGNPQPMASNCLIQTNDGGCVVTGYASSLNGFNGLQSYIFIFKLASDGNLRWQMTYSTLADRNSALYAVQTKDDSYVLAGTMLSNTTGLETIWFATVNSTGSVTAPLTNQTLQLRSAQPLPTATGLLGQSTKSQSTGMQSWYLGIIVAVLAIVIILAVVLAIKNKNHSHQPLAGN
jgi:hypothetical protein